MRKTALITGITGQDGSYLTEFLLEKGYDVHGIMRRSSSFNTSRIDHVFHKIHMHYGDVIDSSNISAVIAKVQPDEIYHLAAQSHVKVSFDMPDYTAEVDGVGTVRVLEAIRSAGLQNKTRFYQASTSELFGLVQEIPQTETTPFYPRSPYGCAKLYAFWIVKNYRESYNMFCVNGILFNHESPRRGGTFVTKKITAAIAAIKAGTQDVLRLGNMDSKRDWGHARDYVRMMWMMLQQNHPDDYVVATGKQYSVRDFCNLAFDMAEMELEWVGEGVNERGIEKTTRRVLVVIDERYFRPSEVETLLGNPAKAKRELGWENEVSFKQLVYDMMNQDFKRAGQTLPQRALEISGPLPEWMESQPHIVEEQNPTNNNYA
eukprot:GEMP01026775.1.p1 GENE.GEMP01026775.1~~GEMP01026775.1.p1  ORF type:complete len:375 (+),score=77.12 GEMP01026775.1:70-1194(+)